MTRSVLGTCQTYCGLCSIYPYKTLDVGQLGISLDIKSRKRITDINPRQSLQTETIFVTVRAIRILLNVRLVVINGMMMAGLGSRSNKTFYEIQTSFYIEPLDQDVGLFLSSRGRTSIRIIERHPHKPAMGPAIPIQAMARHNSNFQSENIKLHF